MRDLGNIHPEEDALRARVRELENALTKCMEVLMNENATTGQPISALGYGSAALHKEPTK